MPPVSSQSRLPVSSGLDPEAALVRVLEGVEAVTRSEPVAVLEARGRVLARDAHASVALPRFTSSAMDGYGLHGDDLPLAAGRTLQLAQRIHAGHLGSVEPLLPGMAVRLTTGAVVPRGVAAIVPDEDVVLATGGIRIGKAPATGANIRRAGEDVEAGSLVAGVDICLTPPQLMLLAAAGLDTVVVWRRARIGLLSSGNELVDPGTTPAGAEIVDTNRLMLTQMLAGADVELVDLGIAPDRLDALEETMDQARELDLLITTGGAANSEVDLLAEAIRAAGGYLDALVLDLKPGRRLGHGRLGMARVLCLPGNPAAALVTALLFALPLIGRLTGRIAPPRWQPVTALAPIRSRPGRTTIMAVRASTNALGEIVGVTPSGPNDSHRLLPLALADGLVRIAAADTGVEAGTPVPFIPMASVFGTRAGDAGR